MDLENKEKKELTFPVLRYLILGLILFNFPGFTLLYINDSISSILSYLSYGLIMLYVILVGKKGNSLGMILIGLLYFVISSLSNQAYMPEFKLLVIIITKYFIIIIGGYEVVKRIKKEEMWLFMFVGALSILGHIFIWNNPLKDYGRYSGFYLDPNTAGLICLMGYSLCYSMSKNIGLIGKLTFTIMGLITFSRTFIILWLLINILSIRLSMKNIRMLLVGFGILSTLLVFNEFLPVKNQRLEQIGAMVSGNEQKAKGIDEDSRWETWSRYYDALLDKPIFGNGYGGFGTNGVAPPVGVHNTYLLLWGEAGVIAIIVFIIYITWLLYQSNRFFKKAPYLLMMTISLSFFLLTNHNFFTTDFCLFIILFIEVNIKKYIKVPEFGTQYK